MIRKILKISSIVFLALFSQNAFCSSEVSNAQIVNEIEKALVFDKDSKQRMDVYNNERSVRKSDYTIKAEVEKDSSEKEEDKKSEIEIFLTPKKAENFDIREKEKMAYNSAIIGQDEVAIELYKNVIKEEPENEYAKFSLAVVYQKLGQFKKSKAIYHDLLKVSQDRKEEIIGNLLSIMIDESPKEAIYFLSRLSVQNANSADIFAKLAVAYDKTKDYNSAINALKTAVNLDRNSLEYRYNLAVIYDKVEEKEKALTLYSEVDKEYLASNSSIPINQVRDRMTVLRKEI